MVICIRLYNLQLVRRAGCRPASDKPGDPVVVQEPSASLYKILRFLAWDGILCDMGKHTHIELTSEERTELEQRIRTGNAPARTHTRARILLLSDRSQGQKRTD